jgi:hypothetical protein
MKEASFLCDVTLRTVRYSEFAAQHRSRGGYNSHFQDPATEHMLDSAFICKRHGLPYVAYVHMMMRLISSLPAPPHPYYLRPHSALLPACGDGSRRCPAHLSEKRKETSSLKEVHRENRHSNRSRLASLDRLPGCSNLVPLVAVIYVSYACIY